jgi:F0F1-type ATP synthase membrane subunit a
MDRFLNRLTHQYDDMNISSDGNEKKDRRFFHFLLSLIFFIFLENNLSKSDKLSILHDTFPHLDDQTLEYYFETYHGDIDTIVHELLN